MPNASFSVAVFPFLKTSRPVSLGRYVFRSTVDVAGLPDVQATAVTEIANMLFVKDDMRVVSASYAIVPYINFHSPIADYFYLAFLRSVIAYVYSSPHDIFDNLLLAPEEASLILLVPEKVSAFLVRPERHTESVSTRPGPETDAYRMMPGYYGVYNFAHHFWVARESRIYGLKPQITLNIHQDLALDFEVRLAGNREMGLLIDLVGKSLTPTANRIITALHWYNAANEAGADTNKAIMCLAIAFEALLRLPAEAKSERIVDAIALLLGRTERLRDWAEQFYVARSQVAHEGFISDGFYYAPGGSKTRDAVRRSGTLMQYGRQVFRLCLSTLLVGADLAESAHLRDKFISNNEHYEEICQLLDTDAFGAKERFKRIVPTVSALEQYRFVRGGVVAQETAVGAVRRASSLLANSGLGLARETQDALQKVGNSRRQDRELERLSAIYELRTAYEKLEHANLLDEERVVKRLVEAVWMDVFDRYFRLRSQEDSGA